MAFLSLGALVESGEISKLEVGTFKGLADIHRILFDDIYDFAGKICDVNIAKDGFSFVARMFLEQSLKYLIRIH